MDNNERIRKLTSLIQVDIDAVHAYQQAIDKLAFQESIDNLDHETIRDQLSLYKQDHERHVKNLSECVKELGGQPPASAKDFKGFVIQGFTELASVTGVEGLLNAMKANEKLTNSTYDDAIGWDLSKEMIQVIRRNREDEVRHLRYIEQALEERIWEKGKEAA